jgi:hypothetical protein
MVSPHGIDGRSARLLVDAPVEEKLEQLAVPDEGHGLGQQVVHAAEGVEHAGAHLLLLDIGTDE